MSETCTHNCETCGASCPSNTAGQDLRAPLHPQSNITQVIGVVSGKGGVGKSMVSSLIACELNRKGLRVGILDADITGPSIPRMFGRTDKATGDSSGILPVVSDTGIKMMSVNFLLEDEAQPVIWRGPVISGVVKQFWSEVIWGEIDVLVVDLPPGTGDVALTVFQSMPIDGLVIVTTPQALVSMVVEKAVNMAAEMDIPVLGLVENMAYVRCPDCGDEIALFGPSHTAQVALSHNLPILARLPLDANIAGLADSGKTEEIQSEEIAQAVQRIMA